MRKALFFCFTIILMSSVFTSCKKGKKVIDPGFSEYISAFTSGEISVSSNIRIELTDEIKEEVLPNTEITEDLFDFSPNINGKAYWIDKRTIEFRPDEWLKSGKDYEVKFYLKNILKIDKKFRIFEFGFNTKKQSFAVSIDGYEPYNIENLAKNKITGLIQTADVVDESRLEKILTSKQGDKKLSISWQHSENNIHKYQIDSVGRYEKESKVEIAWDGNDIDVDNKGEEVLIIPSIYDFLVLEAKAFQEPNQYISLRFSDPLDKKQDLKGLITIDKNADLNFEIDKNTVNIYFSEKISGTLKLDVNIGVRNSMGSPLKESYRKEIVFENIKPAVRLLGKGNILPDSKGLIFPFEAVNIKAVDVRIVKIFENNVPQFFQVNNYDGQYQLKRAGRLIILKTISLSGTDKLIDYKQWNTFSLDLSELIKQEPGAIYRIELSFKKSYSTYPCEGDSESDDKKTDEFQTVSTDEFEKELEYWDAGDDYYEYEYSDYDYEGEGDGYDWNERDNPCSASYFAENRKVTTNIIASNIGLIAKGYGNNSISLAVTDIVSANPLASVNIDILNYQQQIIGSATTDGNGFCTIEAKGKPFLIVAKNDLQRGYLKVDDGSALSVSQFDVSGQTIQKGIKGFIYGERGVWRPGDTVFLTCIIEDKLKQLPSTYPIVLELFTPQGQLFKKIVKTSGMNGFYSFAFKTNDDSPTGNWQINIKLGTVIFSKKLRIETVKPNRLKVNLDIGKAIINTGKFSGLLTAKWLHGAPASGLKFQVTANVSKLNTAFKGYDGFYFDDLTRIFNVEEKSVSQGNLDSDGNYTIEGGLDLDNSAPGMLRAAILTRVYEPGGEFSIDNQIATISPYMSYVGIKIPKDKFGYLETDTNQYFELATVNKDGKPVNKNNLEVYIYKLDRNWWWNASNDVLANYESNTYATPVFHQKVNTVNGKGRFKYRLNYPDWGRFLVRVVDNDGGHATGKVLYFDWPGWRGRADRADSKSAAMLSFNTDKNTYNVSEKANIIFPSPKNGRILISLETGSKVLKQWWEESSGKETKISFDITEEMAPNIYINATLIQPHSSKTNDLPIRMYGIVPVKIENPVSHLYPEIIVPAIIRPETEFTVGVKEKNSKKMTYTLAIVDEGLLDLTRFKTPDPWTEFYGREALGVKTWDLYDYIIGSYGGTIEKLFAIGGDGDLRGSGDKKANRFKSIVKFLGPFEYTGGLQEHKILLPQYIGSVKVMVIAGNGSAFGNAEKAVPVRKPLMVLATLPRVVGPGEMVILPVSVFALESKVRNVSVEVQTSSNFKIDGSSSKTITFNKPGESDITFKLNVVPKIGVGKVKVIVKSGNEVDQYEIEIEIRNPNPKIKLFFEEFLEPGKTSTLQYKLPGIAGTNKATIEISSIPAIDLRRRLGYLIEYPHGCAEQTTSGAFPQLFISNFVELDDLSKKRTLENIQAAIQRLNTMQLSDGGVAYWPGLADPNLWITSYVGHFMLLAKEKGYEIPSGFLKNWQKFQKKEARNWVNSTSTYEYYYQNDLIQAYRLYTLALAGEPEIGAMNRMKESKNLSIQAIWRLAATYALAGQPEIAKQLMVKGNDDLKPYLGFNYTYGSLERDWAMVLETYALVNDKANSFVYLKKLAAVLSNDSWLSTQSTAYSLYAIGKCVDQLKLGGPVNVSYAVNGKSLVKVDSKFPLVQNSIDPNTINGNIKVSNSGKGSLFVRVMTEGLPEVGPVEGYENNLQMNVRFNDKDGNSLNIDNLKQGEDFIMEVSVRNSSQIGNYKDLALTQILPSGCEIINARFLEMESEENTNVFTYQDIRDDRVLTYFDLKRGESKTFSIRLNASYSGRYYFPGVYCEAMYEAKVNALSTGQWIVIE